MTALTLEEVADGDSRLSRRLATAELRPAEVLPLIRSTLVARGYGSVRTSGTLLASFERIDWRAHGFIPIANEEWKAEPWLPSWLDHRGIAPDEAVARRILRRPVWKVTADDFYREVMGQDTYLSPGQKVCVRSVAAAREGSSVICILPTGSGKTDVVLTRALFRRPQQTCLVVPTVALALDLERRVQELTGEQAAFAYHGGLGAQVKAQLAARVRDGAQWLVITSPEAACTVLARPLEAAAQSGRLDLLGIDEAHIVAEWGDAFRPAFHALAGLRRRLLQLAPAGRRPVTVMLTATLDDYGLETLRRLFNGEEDLLISAQATRPEPAWWMHHCASEDEKRNRFLEVVRHLPRPMIVYTTLHTSERSTNVGTALSWLRDAGIRAVRGVAGGSGRQGAASGLRMGGDPDADLDIVVATSAFGLGVDISDVRAVIHLCIPESVDRLYQEVGRGGRQGTAAASVVLWSDDDAEVAKGLSRARLIGEDKAWKHWQAMRTGPSDEGLIQVDLTASTDDVRYPWSDANRYWNLQTLSGMDRADMIRLEWPLPAEVPIEASDADLDDVFAAQRASTSVRILHSNHGDEIAFKKSFRQGRERSRGASGASLWSATELLSAHNECVNRKLASHYRLHVPSGLLPPERQCGGCPHCRSTYSRPVTLNHPATPLMEGTLTRPGDGTLRALAPEGRLCIWTDSPNPQAEQELVTRLVAHGVMSLVSVGPWSPLPRHPGPWWEERVHTCLEANTNFHVPTLVRLDGDGPSVHEAAILLARVRYGTLTVVLTTRDYPDPRDDRAYLHEGWGPAYQIDQVLRRL